MINNEEVIFKEHDLKLAIQKAIIENQSEILLTGDIGYTSWQIATQIVENQKKIKKENRFKKVNKLIKIILDNNKVEL